MLFENYEDIACAFCYGGGQCNINYVVTLNYLVNRSFDSQWLRPAKESFARRRKALRKRGRGLICKCNMYIDVIGYLESHGRFISLIKGAHKEPWSVLK